MTGIAIQVVIMKAKLEQVASIPKTVATPIHANKTASVASPYAYAFNGSSVAYA